MKPIKLIPVKGISRKRAAHKPIANEHVIELNRIAKKYNATQSQILYSMIERCIQVEKEVGFQFTPGED